MNIFKSFKKIFVIIMIICILIGISNKVFAAMLTLKQVVDKFNSSNPMAEHLKDTYDATVVATLEGNKIILTENNCPFTDSKIQKVEFNLENNVLSTTINKPKELTTAYMSELSMAWMLIDCIGQLNGYEKEQFYETLKGIGDNYKNYTLSKEGLEIKTLDNSTSIKIDLSKKIPIINEETETNEDISKNTEDVNLNNTDKANKTENEIQDNTIKEKQNNEVLNVNKKEDNTTTNSKLPQTGSNDNIIIVIVIVNLIVAFIFFIRYKKDKNI